MMPYERLTAWRSAHELALAVYRATDAFPKHELYGLTSQLRRAAFSVGANIAEGVAKRGNGEFRRFLDIAIGSLSEISYATLLAKDLGILKPESAEAIEGVREKTSKLTWGLYKSVSRNGSKRVAAP
jgi:four helix bundle protein